MPATVPSTIHCQPPAACAAPNSPIASAAHGPRERAQRASARPARSRGTALPRRASRSAGCSRATASPTAATGAQPTRPIASAPVTRPPLRRPPPRRCAARATAGCRGRPTAAPQPQADERLVEIQVHRERHGIRREARRADHARIVEAGNQVQAERDRDGGKDDVRGDAHRARALGHHAPGGRGQQRERASASGPSCRTPARTHSRARRGRRSGRAAGDATRTRRPRTARARSWRTEGAKGT